MTASPFVCCSSWLSGWFGSRPNRQQRFRPTLENLEDRCTPAVIMVDSLGDSHVDGQTTLREAIQQANTSRGDDTIQFSASLTGTITLTQGQLTLSDQAGETRILG